MILPTDGSVTQNTYMAYITADKVGLQKFPLTGNPFDSIALFAHPEGVYSNNNEICIKKAINSIFERSLI